LSTRSPSSNAIVLLGGGRGLARVLRALRGVDCDPTVIVSIAYDERAGNDVLRQANGATVEDLRRSLEALAGDELALMRAIRRPLTVERLGRYPLGNFVIASLARAFGDHAAASRWLGEQLGVSGMVLPATTEPVPLEIELDDDEVTNAGRGGASAGRLRHARFATKHLEAPSEAVAAIKGARWALLAPGSLYRSVLSASAVPDLTSALRSTHARVVWMANLEPDSHDTAGMAGIDHLSALRRHGVRVDAALYDPEATLRLEPAVLARYGVAPIPRALRSSSDHAAHDPDRLRSALRELFSSLPTGAVGR
jgi:uncharacterized cofD-like protein